VGKFIPVPGYFWPENDGSEVKKSLWSIECHRNGDKEVSLEILKICIYKYVNASYCGGDMNVCAIAMDIQLFSDGHCLDFAQLRMNAIW